MLQVSATVNGIPTLFLLDTGAVVTKLVKDIWIRVNAKHVRLEWPRNCYVQPATLQYTLDQTAEKFQQELGTLQGYDSLAIYVIACRCWRMRKHWR